MKVVKKIEHTWHESNDRFIYTEWENGILTGINFMQGDEYEYFIKEFNKPDDDLIIFYNAINHYVKGKDFHDVLNNVFWMYHDCIQAFKTIEANKKSKELALESHGEVDEVSIEKTDEYIDDLFTAVHNAVGTKYGDITPIQNERLNNIKQDLAKLVIEQVKQNLK